MLPLVKKRDVGIGLGERGRRRLAGIAAERLEIEVAPRAGAPADVGRGGNGRFLGDQGSGLAVDGVGHQQARPGQAHDLRGLVRSEARVQRREHSSQLRQGREQRQYLEPGVGPADDAVAAPDAQLAERARDAVAGGIQLGVGQLR